jgi:hypothetical protein
MAATARFGVSQIAFFAETVLLALPVTLLSLFSPLILLRPLHPAVFPVVGMAMFGLVGFWVLAIAYLNRGAPALEDANPLWWVLALLGLLATMAGAIDFRGGSPDSIVGFAIVGVPVVVPLAHLALAYAFASRRKPGERRWVDLAVAASWLILPAVLLRGADWPVWVRALALVTPPALTYSWWWRERG